MAILLNADDLIHELGEAEKRSMLSLWIPSTIIVVSYFLAYFWTVVQLPDGDYRIFLLLLMGLGTTLGYLIASTSNKKEKEKVIRSLDQLSSEAS